MDFASFFILLWFIWVKTHCFIYGLLSSVKGMIKTYLLLLCKVRLSYYARSGTVAFADGRPKSLICFVVVFCFLFISVHAHLNYFFLQRILDLYLGMLNTWCFPLGATFFSFNVYNVFCFFSYISFLLLYFIVIIS